MHASASAAGMQQVNPINYKHSRFPDTSAHSRRVQIMIKSSEPGIFTHTETETETDAAEREEPNKRTAVAHTGMK